MEKFRKIICFFFGHNSMILGIALYTRDGNPWSTCTVNECERCGHRTENQWDY